MRNVIAIVVLAALVSAALVESFRLKFPKGSIFKRSLATAPGHELDLREQLGQFKEGLLRNLYKYYAAAFVHPNHEERDNDHYGNYMATGDECMTYLRNFRVNGYKVKDLDEFVLLDSCLGYLYESNFKEEDKVRPLVAQHLPELLKDTELAKIWENTQFKKLNDDAKICAGNLMMDWILVKHQFPDVSCNNHMIAILNNFGDCHSAIPEDQRETDSYLKIIYDLVRKNGNRCFSEEIRHTNEAARDIYASDVTDRAWNSLSKFIKPLNRQSQVNMWPKKITNVLSAVQGTDHEVNSREVANIMTGIWEQDADYTERFFKNLAKYADKTVQPTKNAKKQAHAKDVYGTTRYEKAMDGLCNFFRVSDDSSDYDFVTPFQELIRMLDHEDLFGINQKYFIFHALQRSTESGPIYLAVTACQLITFTDPSLQTPQTGNGEYHYLVTWKPNTSEMVRWPQLPHY